MVNPQNLVNKTLIPGWSKFDTIDDNSPTEVKTTIILFSYSYYFKYAGDVQTKQMCADR